MILIILCTFLFGTEVAYGQFVLSFGTPTPAGPLPFQSCKDKVDNCYNYDESSCKAPYDSWARENCPQRCGFCIGATTPAPPCVNKLRNCDTYNKDVCSQPEYKAWAGENCRYYCRMCPPAELARLDAIVTTIAPANCVDKVDCRQYGANACGNKFKAWSKANCPAHCGYCVGVPTPPPNCQDKLPNCKDYNRDTCSNPDFKLWVNDNCRKYCGLCAGGGGPQPQTAAPTMKPGYAVPPVPGQNPGVISYVPPTPPLPGRKRNVEKRQFHASHHHFGGIHACWDSEGKFKNDDPYCKTPVPDFPGSEFKPRPTPTDGWDKKPTGGHQSSSQSTQDPANGTTPQQNSTTDTPLSNITTPETSAPPTTLNNSSLTVSNLSTETTTTDDPSTETTETTSVGSASSTSSSPSSMGSASSSSATTSTPTSSSASPATAAPTNLTSPASPSPNTPSSVTTKSVPSTSPSTASRASQSTGSPSIASTMSQITAQSTQTPSSATVTTQAQTSASVQTISTIVSTQSPTKSTVTPSPVTTIALTTSPHTVATTSPCKDQVANCADYGEAFCSSPTYGPWARSHCEAFCGFCHADTQCKDKLPNCNEFDSGNLCTSQSYFAWARENCFAYCGFPPCGHTTKANTQTTTAPVNPSTAQAVAAPATKSGDCADTLPNCLLYPDYQCVGIYSGWAKSHCTKRCGYCNDTIPCVDLNPDCALFPSDICVKDSYQGWARENCRKFCNLCSRPTIVTHTGTHTATPGSPVRSETPVIATSSATPAIPVRSPTPTAG